MAFNKLLYVNFKLADNIQVHSLMSTLIRLFLTPSDLVGFVPESSVRTYGKLLATAATPNSFLHRISSGFKKVIDIYLGGN